MATYLPPRRPKAKHSNLLLMLVLIAVVGAFVYYMMMNSDDDDDSSSPSSGDTKDDDTGDDGGKTPDEHVGQDDQLLKACKAKARTTGECQMDGGKARFKCNDKRYGANCSKTCHSDAHSLAVYSPGFESGTGAATCKCPDKFHFEKTDIERGGCLSGGTCTGGYIGKDCSSKEKTLDEVLGDWTEMSSKHNFILENDGNATRGDQCKSEAATNVIPLCSAFTYGSVVNLNTITKVIKGGKPDMNHCLTTDAICENNLAEEIHAQDRPLCGIKQDCDDGDFTVGNISSIQYPKNTSMTMWNNNSMCSGKSQKFTLCRGLSCTAKAHGGDHSSLTRGKDRDGNWEQLSFTFGLAPGHYLKCDDKVFVGADTGDAKIQEGKFKNVHRV